MSVNVALRVLIVACRDLPITSFLSNFWGLAILKKLNKETRVYRAKISLVTSILKHAKYYQRGLADKVDWLVVWVQRPFETVFQTILGRLQGTERKERKDR